MTSTDKRIVESIVGTFDFFNEYVEKNVKCPTDLNHPLDKDIQGAVAGLKGLEDEEYAIFKRVEEVKGLWKKLVEK